MAPARKPGPIGIILQTATDALNEFGRDLMPAIEGKWDCPTDPKHTHIPGSVGICPPWVRHLYAKKVGLISIHVFFHDSDLPESDFEQRISGTAPAPDDGKFHEPLLGYWDDVNVVFHVATADLKAEKKLLQHSLAQEGAIVVYFGHGSMGKADPKTHFFGHAYGLIPDPANKNEPVYTKAEFQADLKKSRAALLVLAGCDSQALVGKWDGTGPMLISTDSGADNVSWDTNMAAAITTLLLALRGFEYDKPGTWATHNSRGSGGGWATNRAGGNATIGIALNAANREFAVRGDHDHFVLSRGDSAAVLFPD